MLPVRMGRTIATGKEQGGFVSDKPTIVAVFGESGPNAPPITHFVWSDGWWSSFNPYHPYQEHANHWSHKRIERPPKVDD